MVNNNIRPAKDDQPRFFYGYFVVAASFFIIMVSFGFYGTFGIFFNSLLEEFGWTRATTSVAYSLSMIMQGILAIVMGGLCDRFGPRIVLTFCGITLGLGYLLMSQVHSLWQLYLFYGLIIGTGMSGIWIPLLSTVARWFTLRRSLMSGLVIAGGGIGSFIASPTIGWLISIYGWRKSYLIVGILVLAVIVIAAQFMKRDPVKTGQLPYGEDRANNQNQKLPAESKVFTLTEALRTRQFWLTFTMLACFGFCMIAITVHIVPHAIDLGTPAVKAANILAIRGGLGILGSYLLGSLGDKIGNRRLFIIGFILLTVDLLWLIPAGELWMLYLFAVFFGFAVGGMGASESPLVAGLFGLRSHGVIYGVLSIGFTVGASIGPIAAGYIFDLTGSYQIAFWICAALGAAGLALVAILRPTNK